MVLLLLVASAWLSPVHAGAKEAPAFRILAPGTFHGWEVKSESTGEAWLGLFRDGAAWELLPVEIEVRPAVDPYLDREGERTALQVFVPGVGPEPSPEDWDFAASPEAAEAAGQPILFLQPLTGFAGDRWIDRLGGMPEILPGSELILGEDGTRILATGKAFYLESDGIRQPLGRLYPDSHGESVTLLWAGDLDGDGSVDLILDHISHYALRLGYRLFLSGGAGPGILVRQAAAFITVGC